MAAVQINYNNQLNPTIIPEPQPHYAFEFWVWKTKALDLIAGYKNEIVGKYKILGEQEAEIKQRKRTLEEAGYHNSYEGYSRDIGNINLNISLLRAKEYEYSCLFETIFAKVFGYSNGILTDYARGRMTAGEFKKYLMNFQMIFDAGHNLNLPHFETDTTARLLKAIEKYLPEEKE